MPWVKLQSPTCLNPSLNKAEFEKIAEDVKKLKTRPTDLQLLDLYGLYKQAVMGDITIGMSSCTGRGGHILGCVIRVISC